MGSNPIWGGIFLSSHLTMHNNYLSCISHITDLGVWLVASLTCLNPFTPKRAMCSILLCLTPDNFTHPWGTLRSQWVNHSLKNCPIKVTLSP